jgi:hypothetical protein
MQVYVKYLSISCIFEGVLTEKNEKNIMINDNTTVITNQLS